MSQLDAHPRTQMQKGDAERIVELHRADYCDQWEAHLRAAESLARNAGEFVQVERNYSNKVVKQLKTYEESLLLAEKKLEATIAAISEDIEMLERHTSIKGRLRAALLRSPRS